jgi:O-antigen ligase
MVGSRFALIRKSFWVEVFGDRGPQYFWEARFLPRWLPIILGVILGIASAILIVNGAVHFLIPLVLAVPLLILFNRYPFVAIILWMLLFPYFVREPSAAGRYIYWMLHRAMIPATLGIVLLSHWLGIRKRPMVQFGRAELATLAFLILTVINIYLLNVTGVEKILIQFYDRLFVPICLYWLVRMIAPNRKDLRRFLWVAFFTVLAQCIIGLVSWFMPSMLPPQWITDKVGVRTVGTFGNPAVYTSTLMFLSLLLFQYGMHCKSRWLRGFIILTFGLAIFCVFFSFSRGSWLGGVLVVLGLMFLYPKLTLRLSAIVLAVTLVLGQSVLAREIAFSYDRLQHEDSADGRIVGNAASIRMIQERFWYGWGYGNYDLYNRQFLDRVGDISSVDHEATSHNSFLSMAAELGVPLLLLYMFPVVWWLLLSIKVWRRMPQTGFWSSTLLAMMWLFMLDWFAVANFMDMMRLNLFGTSMWWLGLGFIANMVYPYLKTSDMGVPTWISQPNQLNDLSQSTR